MRYAPCAGLIAMLAGAHALAGQAITRYSAGRLDGAIFTEQVHSDVTTQSGSAERHRIVVRRAQFHLLARGDSLVVTVDTLDLHESSGGTDAVVDVDAVIGGRWIVQLEPRGNTRVLVRPFVPAEIGDVSDIATAMTDFFPVAPPALVSGRQATDSAKRSWHRGADSAGLARYHWSSQRHDDSNYVAADSVPVRTSVDSRDEGDVAWDGMRGPVAWSRHVAITATSRFSGRTNRAIVDQHIVVRRTHELSQR